MDSVLDHLRRAVTRLALEGSVKDRLAEAWLMHLSSLDAEQLPEGCRDEFNDLRHTLCREAPLPREPAVRASVRKMSAAEAGRCATRIVGLFATVARDLQRQPVQRLPQPSTQVVVPLFAAEA